MFVGTIALAVAFLYVVITGHVERQRMETDADQRVAFYEDQVNRVCAQNSDLLNRLAARNLPEYQAYQPDTDPSPAKTYWSDDFGLVSSEASD